jgi:hypothetical protein
MYFRRVLAGIHKLLRSANAWSRSESCFLWIPHWWLYSTCLALSSVQIAIIFFNINNMYWINNKYWIIKIIVYNGLETSANPGSISDTVGARGSNYETFYPSVFCIYYIGISIASSEDSGYSSQYGRQERT